MCYLHRPRPICFRGRTSPHAMRRTLTLNLFCQLLLLLLCVGAEADEETVSPRFSEPTQMEFHQYEQQVWDMKLCDSQRYCALDTNGTTLFWIEQKITDRQVRRGFRIVFQKILSYHLGGIREVINAQRQYNLRVRREDSDWPHEIRYSHEIQINGRLTVAILRLPYQDLLDEVSANWKHFQELCGGTVQQQSEISETSCQLSLEEFKAKMEYVIESTSFPNVYLMERAKAVLRASNAADRLREVLDSLVRTLNDPPRRFVDDHTELEPDEIPPALLIEINDAWTAATGEIEKLHNDYSPAPQ